MFGDDVLDDWIFLTRFEIPAGRLYELRTAAHDELQKLADFLDNLPKKRWNMGDASRVSPYLSQSGLFPADLPLAQTLYRRVFETGGTGNTGVQEGLLGLIACTADPALVPFWLETLDLVKLRDHFAGQRRDMALAALALLVFRQEDPAAGEALLKATHHTRPEVRALAVYYLGRAYQEAELALPPEVVAELARIAAKGRAFGPRFQARSALKAAGHPVAMDNPGGVYALKVKFKWAKRIYRTIELRSEQTLDDLHFAILRAIDWGSDHLYSFYMNNVKYSHRYSFACPYQDDSPPWTDEAIIGELGLVKRHKFMYHFDYGDDNLFEVEVVDIRPGADEAKYPRVVDSRGEAPAQYGRW